MEELLEQWAEDPIRNLNLLNTLIPSLIAAFDAEGGKRSAVKDVIAIIESIREVLDER